VTRLTHETGIPVEVARDPLHCVAIGSDQCLEEFEALKQVLIGSSSRSSPTERVSVTPVAPAAPRWAHCNRTRAR
jgi:hypothetical protein